MIKIVSILILLSCIGTVSAFNYENTSFTYLAGEQVVTPYYQLDDEYFSFHNDGSARYMIYQYNYIGPAGSLKDTFIGTIEPNQVIMLTTNASYRIYADYNGLRDIGNPDIVIDRIQSWWYVIIYLVLIIVTTLAVWKVVRK